MGLLKEPMLRERPFLMRDEDHRYFDLRTGRWMQVSVTAVINWFEPPYDGPPEAGWRGDHVHRLMEAKAKGNPEPEPISPEGIDCSGWFDKLQSAEFWQSNQGILASEYTCIDSRLSLGGQIDLIFKDADGRICLCDLKTKGASYTYCKPEDQIKWQKQAGGYLRLLQNGDDARGGLQVDYCQTLVITPKACDSKKRKLKPIYSTEYKPDDCVAAWDQCWADYVAAARTSF